MLDNKLLHLIDDTAVALELASTVVEKDYYVTVNNGVIMRQQARKVSNQ